MILHLDLNDMLYALSYALDCVEGELLGARAYHSERVAYIAVRIAGTMGIPADGLSALAAAAVLHDNALTEYIGSERSSLEERDVDPDSAAARDVYLGEIRANFERHCSVGERNVQVLPFYDRIRGAVQCHHENADGSGVYHLAPGETPLFAQLIHFADVLDNRFDLSEVDEKKHREIHAFAAENRGRLFSAQLVEAFEQTFPLRTEDLLMENASRALLHDILPAQPREYSGAEIEGIASLFAHIVDYKSHFTCTHSIGIARKVRSMAAFYRFEPEMQTKLYLAGALHDIGKCSIPNSILEKPDSLTAEEFAVMKKHVLISWRILDRIEGFSDIRDWAALHHEKLNGQGYPFGKTAAELSFNDRLMGCIDVYQALTEARPYRGGMPHRDAVAVMEGMASENLIDAGITRDIDARFGELGRDGLL